MNNKEAGALGMKCKCCYVLAYLFLASK